MEYDNQDEKLGGGIITICVLHFIGLFFTLISLVTSFFMKDFPAQYNVGPSTYVISTIISIIISTGAILILRKVKLGIAIYYVGVLVNLISSIAISGFSILGIISILLLPILMAIFLNSKKELFGFGNK